MNHRQDLDRSHHLLDLVEGKFLSGWLARHLNGCYGSRIRQLSPLSCFFNNFCFTKGLNQVQIKSTQVNPVFTTSMCGGFEGWSSPGAHSASRRALSHFSVLQHSSDLSQSHNAHLFTRYTFILLTLRSLSRKLNGSISSIFWPKDK